MLKQFKDYLSEVVGRDDLNIRTSKRKVFSSFGSININKKIGLEGKEKLFSKYEYDVYKSSTPTTLDIFVIDKTRKVFIELILNKSGKMYYVDSALSISNNYKVHELYRDLLIKKVIEGLITGEQSEGGRAIWNKLSQYRDIQVFGWDPYHREAINLGKRLPDEVETHISISDSAKDSDTNKIRRMQLIAIKKI